MAVRDLIPRLRSRTPTLRNESANPLVAFHQEMNRLCSPADLLTRGPARLRAN